MRRARAWGLLASLAATSCELFAGTRFPFGALVVRVQASDEATLRRIRCVTVTAPRSADPTSRTSLTRCFRGASRSYFPAQYILLRQTSQAADLARVEVDAVLVGGAGFSQQARVPFPTRGLRLAVFDLNARCVGVVCPPGFTCGGDGACAQPVVRDPLPAYDPSDLPPEYDLEALYPDDDASVMTDAALDARADAPDADVRDAPDAPTDGCVSCDEDGVCTDLATDPAHCGACGRRCGMREGCAAGACVAAPVAGIAAGFQRTCAWMRDGSVRCWGGNTAEAVLGARTGAGAVARPLRSSGLRDVTQLALSDTFTCALSRGRVRCLGVPPAGAEAIEGATTLAAGPGYLCAGGMTGVRCVGSNDWGQLGDGTTTPRATPVAVLGLPGGEPTFVSARYHSACAGVAGRVACWGMNAWGQLGGEPGALRCGTGLACRPSAVAVDGLDGVERAATQGLSLRRGAVGGVPVFTEVGATCAVERSRAVRCWGQGALVGLGADAGALRAAPGAAIPSLRATDVVMGLDFACALEEGGTVACWGLNDACQTGSTADAGARVDAPRRVVGLTGVRALAAGTAHACALRDDGEVLCWGSNESGQLGQGATASPACAPAPVRW